MSKALQCSPVGPEMAALLRALAEKYERASFCDDDPIRCLRGAGSGANLEATAFVAASLSYGSRKQFLPKIDWIIRRAGGNVRDWILSGEFASDFSPDDSSSFYRLFSRALMFRFFSALRETLLKGGPDRSLGGYLQARGVSTGREAVRAICAAFGGRAAPMVPKDDTSACKRICMFLRWMVRDNSPVDKGEWSAWFDKRTLIVPMDVHVARQAERFGLLRQGAPASMRSALTLTAQLAEVFPDDPCKGDFALYGLGVDQCAAAHP